ncbi:MAG: T9SS type A sorting domain-containing protein, partial [Leadbetterella sp.]
ISKTEFFVRIKSCNRLGESNWSNFTKIITPISNLWSPTILNPRPDQILERTNPIVLEFNPINNISLYEIQTKWHSDYSFKTYFESSPKVRLNTNKYILNRIDGDVLIWRVRAIIDNNPGPWTEVQHVFIKPYNSIHYPIHSINDFDSTYPIEFLIGSSATFNSSLEISEFEDFTEVLHTFKFPEKYEINQNKAFYLASNLKPYSEYYVRVKESLNPKFNHYGIKKDLEKTQLSKFKTGELNGNKGIRFFSETIDRSYPRVFSGILVGKNKVYTYSDEGLNAMNFDLSKPKIYNAFSPNANIGNYFYSISLDKNDNIILLDRVSKRLIQEDYNIYVKPVYSLKTIDSKSLKTLHQKDFNILDYSLTKMTVDPLTEKIVDITGNVFQISDNKLKLLHKISSPGLTQIKFYNENLYFIEKNDSKSQNLVKVNLNTYETTRYNHTNSTLGLEITQFFIDSKGNLWIVSDLKDIYVRRLSPDNSWKSFPNKKFNNLPKVLGENSNHIYFSKYDLVSKRTEVSTLNMDSTNFKILKTFIGDDLNSNTASILPTGDAVNITPNRIITYKICPEIPTPEVVISKSEIILGDSINVSILNCSSKVEWVKKELNKYPVSTVLEKFSNFKETPKENTIYKARCINELCNSDFTDDINLKIIPFFTGVANKNVFCKNENISINTGILKNYNVDEDYSVILSNNVQRFEIELSKSLSFWLPSDFPAGNYWLKINTKKLNSTYSDSIQIEIHDVPIFTISNPEKGFVMDSLPVKFSFKGVPPFILSMNDGEIVSHEPSYTKTYTLNSPGTFTYYLYSISDKNCNNKSFVPASFNINVTINPEFETYWIRTFPNPVSKYLNVEIYNKPGEQVVFEIYDNQGKQFLYRKKPILSYLDKFELNLSNLSPGTYLLKIQTETNSEVRRIFIY